MLYFRMGEREFYQPLTKEDKITVVIYRTGIFFSTMIILISAFLAVNSIRTPGPAHPLIMSGLAMNILLLALYLSVGLSVFFIHLYVGKFHRLLKNIYYVSVLCLAALFIVGSGNPVIPIFRVPHYAALLLVPISLCLGFVTAKEAFCFRLTEGYLLAFFMPAYLFLYAVGTLNPVGAAYGLVLMAALLLLFMFRKVFMPIHFDIGDKSAYQP